MGYRVFFLQVGTKETVFLILAIKTLSLSSPTDTASLLEETGFIAPPTGVGIELYMSYGQSSGIKPPLCYRQAS